MYFWRNKKWGSVLLVVFSMAALAGFVFYLGFHIGKNSEKTVYVGNVDGSTQPPTGTAAAGDFDLFWQSWQYIKEDFIDSASISDKNLIYGAVGGMVSSLKDPYTVFFPPQEAKDFREEVDGSFGGIGAEIGIKKEQLVIVAPLDDTPASRSGLKSGDRILAINGTSTAGMDVTEAIRDIRGPIGTEVKLTILRKDWSKPKEFDVERGLIQVPTLKWGMKEDKIAYFKLSSFNAQAEGQFYNASLKALLLGAKGMVLDLRDDPGGFLDVAVDLGGWFLKRGDIVVMERFHGSSDRILRANGNEAWARTPVVVLVNQGSASAAEILAGALRDNRGVPLVGEKTFGKGSVQTLQALKDGSSLKITIAKWVLPSGKVLEKNGIEPDFTVPITDKDIESGNDPQLDKALRILRERIK